MENNFIVYFINTLIILFTLIIIFIYVTGSSFKSYPYYFNLYFCIIITLDNLIRLFPIESRNGLSCKIQAFLLSFFDKLFLISITDYSIVNYISFHNPDYYGAFTKTIYLQLLFLSVFFSLALTIIFYLQGLNTDSKDDICYVNTTNIVKRITDTIYTCFLLIIDLFCIIRILINLHNMKKDTEPGAKFRMISVKYHFWRFSFDLIINLITFIYVILLINKLVKLDLLKDIIYVLICLMNELFFTINKVFYQEFMRIITCKIFNKNQEKNEKDNDNDNDERLSYDINDEEY